MAKFHLWTLAVSLVTSAALQAAQAPPAPTFEVVSVKRNTSVDQAGRISGPTPGQFRIVNIPLRLILLNAFDLRDHQLIGAPDWTWDERFDITATYPAGADPAQYRPMLQRALTDRFGLVTRRERRELPAYRLVVARPDGRLGPQLTPSNVDCVAWLAEKRPQIGAGGPSRVAPGGVRPACMMLGQRTFITGGTRTIAQLALSLQSMVQRPVVDETGLAGTFDIDLQWTSGPSVDARAVDASADSGPSIFTAVEEQLGLKLEPTRAPFDVVVVDAISRPTPD